MTWAGLNISFLGKRGVEMDPTSLAVEILFDLHLLDPWLVPRNPLYIRYYLWHLLL